MSIRAFDNLADRIRLHRQHDTRPILIVEGVTDEKFLRSEYGERWIYFSAAGRVNAIRAIAELAEYSKHSSVICIVDRDFDDAVTSCEHRLPVLSYRNADLEGMITAEEGVLGVVLDNLSSGKVDSPAKRSQLLYDVMSLVVPVSRLRRANFINGWSLPFDEVEPANSVDTKKLSFSIRGYCTSLRAKALENGGESPSLSALIDIADGTVEIAMPICPHGAAEYFSGKDFAAMLGVALRRKYGDLALAQAGRDQMVAALRMSASGRVSRTDWGSKLEAILSLKNALDVQGFEEVVGVTSSARPKEGDNSVA
ncbi:hypothetical protein ACWGFX_40730 [Streptomyces xanthophaeus]